MHKKILGIVVFVILILSVTSLYFIDTPIDNTVGNSINIENEDFTIKVWDKSLNRIVQCHSDNLTLICE